MKNHIIKIIAIFAILVLAVSSFGQRKGSFGGGRMGGGRPHISAPAPSHNFAPRGPMGGGRPVVTAPRGSFGSGVQTRPRTNVPMGAGRPAFNRPVYTSVSSFRAGATLPLSVHFYGNPYAWHGSHIYWYGGGYYSLYPGGPLILGNSMMPGYGAAYGYNPYAVGPRPAVVYRSPLTGLWIFLGIVVVVLIIVGFARR